MVEDIAERRLAGAEGEVLIIEEPELMLTPHQQRHLYEIIRRFAESNQVIYSTRSPAMLDAVHHDEIVRLDRSAKGMSIRRAAEVVLNEDERVRLAAEFDHERNEMFFATSVVLVEGQTERQSFPPIFRRLGLRPGRAGHLDRRSRRQGQPGARRARAGAASDTAPDRLRQRSWPSRPARRTNTSKRHAGRAPVIELEPRFRRRRRHPQPRRQGAERVAQVLDDRCRPDPATFKKIAETAVRLAAGESV